MAQLLAPTARLAGVHRRALSTVVGVLCFLLVVTLILPEYLLGDDFVPEIWDMFADLGIVCALGALLLRRPNVTDGGISRAAVRGLLLALVAVAFVGAGTAAASLVHHGGPFVAIVAVTALALAIVPLRAFVEWRTDVTLFGPRDDPYRVITGLGRLLETTASPDAVLPGVVNTVASVLDLSYLAIEFDDVDGHRIEASTGSPTGPISRMQLTYHGEQLGGLVFATRDRRRLTTSDRRLLDDLARQIGSGVYCVRLMRDLRSSHTALMAARDEERRRLRHDLHDGLGPMLAGIGLASQAARNLMTADPSAADEVLDRVVEEAQAATAEVRRLVDGLRPPELDELGLVEALRQQVRIVYSGGADDDELPVSVEAIGSLDQLTPAVEIAAYRIALEGLVNVIRHARANTCTITIENNGALHVRVRDDGMGLSPDAVPGVGFTSMRARAEELGGTCVIRRRPGVGTEVHAVFPRPSFPA
jgi:signal transduction histidine kinase